MFRQSIYKIMVSAAVAGCLLSNAVYAQQCDDKEPSVTPDSRYQLLNNGQEVKDLKTGLIWQRCVTGEHWSGSHCTGEQKSLSGDEPSSQFATAGKNWRLPTIDELKTLSSGCWQSAINTTIFPSNPERYDTKDRLISSTPYMPGKSEAALLHGQGYRNLSWHWVFETAYGQKTYETFALPTRLVRR